VEVEEAEKEASVLSVFGEQPVLGYTMEQLLTLVPARGGGGGAEKCGGGDAGVLRPNP
jgi:hypothetical protein